MGTVDSQQKRGKAVDKCVGGGERVVVAVKASKEISRTALVWALTHVVQPGDCITLLVVVPAHSSGRKLWGFPFFAGDCASGHRRSHTGTTREQKSDITDLCSQMMHQLHDIYDPTKINVKVKIISGSPCGSVAAESKRAQASWVVLDKQLESEKKRCREELQCNIVVMKRSQPKVLRLNLVRSLEADPGLPCVLPSEVEASPRQNAKDLQDSRPTRGPSVTPTSSPEIETPFSTTEVGTSSVSSSDPATSPLFVSDTNESLQKEERAPAVENDNLNVTSSDSDSESLSPSTAPGLQPWVAEVLSGVHISSKEIEDLSQKLNEGTHISKSRIFSHKFTQHDRNSAISTLNYRSDVDLGNVREGGSSKPNYNTDSNFGGSSRERVASSPDCKSELAFSRHMKESSIVNSRLGTEFGSVREAVSLSRNAPSGPPPLCSVCQHKAPVFGKPPRWFSYTELELSTGGFSQANFLAEGGFGSVHRGILPDGQVIAVKQHKPASSQGDHEFCSEVDVLSCAQHRNVVMLIGFCVEDRRRLLVYEYICNGSLHSHLYGHSRELLEWSARQKVALGAARGLRYLHEECRVGCIVHRDMRPNNILLTHDFQALVGDFGLARWQPDGDLGEETRVIGTIGYLAPEYSQTGQITEKADVYSFGVVLVELITGRKAVDIYRPKGQQLLTEWARPLLEEHTMCELIDPRLGNSYSEREVYCMLRAASLCIRREPHARPRMSQVLRILEGDEPSNISTSGYDPGSRRERSSSYDSGSRSGRLCPDQQQQPQFNSSQQHQTPRDSLKK